MTENIESLVRKKIMNLEEALTWGERLKNEGGKLVFTNGVFDILHAGHVQSLIAARECGDKLIVGLNSDSSVKRLKGESRPIIGENDRALLLASLSFVDAVILFEEDTPLHLINILLPNVLVKSADYSLDNIVGAREVVANRGVVKIMPLVQGLSTTAIIQKIIRGA